VGEFAMRRVQQTPEPIYLVDNDGDEYTIERSAGFVRMVGPDGAEILINADEAEQFTNAILEVAGG
jgi:hypothetical protein